MHDSKDKLKLKVLNLMQRLQQAELSLKEMGQEEFKGVPRKEEKKEEQYIPPDRHFFYIRL
jgi:hypothetical protein